MIELLLLHDKEIITRWPRLLIMNLILKNSNNQMPNFMELAINIAMWKAKKDLSSNKTPKSFMLLMSLSKEMLRSVQRILKTTNPLNLNQS